MFFIELIPKNIELSGQGCDGLSIPGNLPASQLWQPLFLAGYPIFLSVIVIEC